MVSFNGLNFSNIGFNLPFGVKSGNTILDVYSDLSEKKDEYIAVTIANDNKSDMRASASKIGGYGSLLLACAKIGINFAREGKAFKDPIVNWFMNGVNSHINFMRKHNIGRHPVINKLLGCCTYGIGAYAIGAGLGYLVDLYNTTKNTIVNGKISSTKAGENGSWIQSGLKSLYATDEGKQIIKNSIEKNDDGSITVKFIGIGRVYNITKKELNDASRSYITYKSSDGQTVTGFKKKFAKGDGDVLAFELAFEKYCKDVNSGLVNEDKNLPKTMYKFSDTGELLFTNGEPKNLYYLLTGKNGEKYSNSEDDNIQKIYSKLKIRNFVQDYKKNPNKYATEVMLKQDIMGNPKIRVRDKYYAIHYINNGDKFAIESMDGKTAVLFNANKTNEKIIVPFKNIEKYISEVNYVNLDK